MKNIKLLLLIVILFYTILPSCKKGEDDPFLSFRSRKARLVGDWNLTGGSSILTYYDTTQTISYKINSVDINFSTPSSGIFASGTVPYTEDWAIRKDGTFKILKKGQYSVTMEGFWSFANKDNNMGLKNKECLILRVTSQKYIYAGGFKEESYEFEGAYCQISTYNIKQLKNKEIVLTNEGNYSWIDIWSAKYFESASDKFILTAEKN
jgi:hypothetical protein